MVVAVVYGQRPAYLFRQTSGLYRSFLGYAMRRLGST
jgi:hypothetical protein